jgi:thiamine biosynthesis lipoprotein
VTVAATSDALPTRRYVEHVMGMPISLALRGRHTDDPAAHQARDAAMEILREADRVFSTYRPDSHLSRLARAEIELDDCPAEVSEVLALGEQARIESGGAFDVRRTGADGTEVLDPSGVVKGWAVQRAAAALLALEGTGFCLSAGGDMVCHVASDDSPAWRVGIEDPHDPTRALAVVPVRDGGVATSGLAHRGAHIVDARSGEVPRGLASVTVVAHDLVTADVDATAAFALGSEALEWLCSRPGRAGLLVEEDGTARPFRS